MTLLSCTFPWLIPTVFFILLQNVVCQAEKATNTTRDQTTIYQALIYNWVRLSEKKSKLSKDIKDTATYNNEHLEMAITHTYAKWAKMAANISYSLTQKALKSTFYSRNIYVVGILTHHSDISSSRSAQRAVCSTCRLYFARWRYTVGTMYTCTNISGYAF